MFTPNFSNLNHICGLNSDDDDMMRMMLVKNSDDDDMMRMMLVKNSFAA